MRRNDKQIGSPGGLTDLLRQGEVCYLAMVDDGKPYVVPLNYGYRDDALYFHSAPEGRKIDVLRKNPEVCFCVVPEYHLIEGVKGCSWSTGYRSVIGTGKASILTDREEIRTGLEILMAQYSDRAYVFDDRDLDGVVIIKVGIEGVTGKKAPGA